MAEPSKLAQRLRTAGVRAGGPIDLLAVGLARRDEDVDLAETDARDLLARSGGLLALVESLTPALLRDKGLDPFESLRVMALLELGRRAADRGPGEPKSLDDPAAVAALLRPMLAREKREHFVAVLLNAQNQLLKVATIHVGTLTMSVVGPREVFREAIREGASALIVAHNHPSGDPTPSPEDLETTRKLAEVGAMLDIPLLDHVIIGDPRWVSLAQGGHLGR